MHHIFPRIACFLGVMISQIAFAIPVYLKLESFYPSGQHPRSWLESHTRDVQVQLWYHVQTKRNQFGWVPEDHVLSRLKLSQEGFTNSEVPLRPEAKLESVSGRTLPIGARVYIKEFIGSWVRVTLEESSRSYYVPTHALLANELGPSLAYVKTKTPLSSAQRNGRHIDWLAGGSTVSVVNVDHHSVQVRFANHLGFVSRDKLVLREDINRGEISVVGQQIPLRSAPLPNSDLIRPLKYLEALRVSETKLQKWGQVRTTDAGLVWWPISDDFSDGSALSRSEDNQVSTAELFSRKIYDMASSPIIPNVKFVSAEGVYRTVDGKNWTRLLEFTDQNFPIATAKSGAIFIGPYVSVDHGESFHTYIRWDQLVARLHINHPSLNPRLRILEIKPEDSQGRKLKLRLDVGLAQQISFSWDVPSEDLQH